MPSLSVIEDFLSQKHVAVVGVSHQPKEFANLMVKDLRDHGYTVHPVNNSMATFEGGHCYASVKDITEPVDGVLVMVKPAAAVEVVRDCVDARVPRVWLHKGVGPGSVTAEAVALCRENGIAVVDGACPLMFLEPVGFAHRAHRGMRRLTGAFSA
jgi:uncharacterized protein